MRRTIISALSVLLTVALGSILFAQENAIDLRGTWVGETDFPGTPGKDPVTLVLKREGTAYSGTISVGETRNAAIENITFKDDDSFSFEFTMTQGENKIRISVKLDYISDRILGNQLMGAWSMETGVYGLLELELKK